MSEPFTCDCGVKTREPFMIDGRLMCTVCAEAIAPRIVSSRAVSNWSQFQTGQRRVPSALHQKRT